LEIKDITARNLYVFDAFKIPGPGQPALNFDHEEKTLPRKLSYSGKRTLKFKGDIEHCALNAINERIARPSDTGF
jgi:hypothetical protein